MTAGEFVAWVASRCEAFAAKCRDEGILGVEVRLRLLPRDGVGPFHTARTARGSAVHALRTARIASRGYRGTWERVTGADREDISAGEWSDLKLVDRKLGDADVWAAPTAPSGRPIHGSIYWRGLQFDRSDVLAVFPASVPTAPETAPPPSSDVAKPETVPDPAALVLVSPLPAAQQAILAAIAELEQAGELPVGLRAEKRNERINERLKSRGLHPVNKRTIERALRSQG
jgi:hypothetical protein